MRRTKGVFIIGGSGFVGTHLAQKLREGYKVYTTYHTRPVHVPGVTSVHLDLTNQNWVKRLIYTFEPDVIIYAVGKNSVEAAETEIRDCEITHSGGPASIVTVSNIYSPRFILLSNCFVFDGNRGNYHEKDTILPVTQLGKSTVGGENIVRQRSVNHIILRSSPVFGRGNGYRKTFLDELRIALTRGQRIQVPAGEIHSFAPVHALVDVIARLVDGGPKNKVLHFGGITKVSYFDFATAFAKRFKFDPTLISERQSTVNTHQAILDYSLNSSMLLDTLKLNPLVLEEGFDLLEKELIAHP